MDFALTHNNLGNAYVGLGKAREKAANSERAVNSYQLALNVYTREHFPMQYALTQNNLATAYRQLGEVVDTVGNCGKAIAAIEQALFIYSLDQFPLDYAVAQNNLGNTYLVMAKSFKEARYLLLSRQAFEKALRVSATSAPALHEKVKHNMALLDKVCLGNGEKFQ